MRAWHTGSKLVTLLAEVDHDTARQTSHLFDQLEVSLEVFIIMMMFMELESSIFQSIFILGIFSLQEILLPPWWVNLILA